MKLYCYGGALQTTESKPGCITTKSVYGWRWGDDKYAVMGEITEALLSEWPNWGICNLSVKEIPDVIRAEQPSRDRDNA